MSNSPWVANPQLAVRPVGVGPLQGIELGAGQCLEIPYIGDPLSPKPVQMLPVMNSLRFFKFKVLARPPPDSMLCRQLFLSVSRMFTEQMQILSLSSYETKLLL
jgi:hypothetical protein